MDRKNYLDIFLNSFDILLFSTYTVFRNISYHLSVLKKADLVTETKMKNFVYYELNASVVEEIMLWLSELKGGTEHDKKV